VTPEDTEGAEISARDKILEAAEALFCTTGFEGTSVASIAARAGVTKAGVFYHFGSKEKLFEEVLDGYYARQRALFFEAVEGEGDPRARMHRIVDVYHRSLVENRRYLMLVISVLSSDSPHTENIQRSVTPIVDWLKQETERAVPTSGSRSILHFYVSLAGAINHYFSHLKALEPSYDHAMTTEAALAERAEHLHWLVDAIFEKLDREEGD
jgi:AcrR family transcriptional regulator